MPQQCNQGSHIVQGQPNEVVVPSAAIIMRNPMSFHNDLLGVGIPTDIVLPLVFLPRFQVKIGENAGCAAIPL